jgi:hypothetical protein
VKTAPRVGLAAALLVLGLLPACDISGADANGEGELRQEVEGVLEQYWAARGHHVPSQVQGVSTGPAFDESRAREVYEQVDQVLGLIPPIVRKEVQLEIEILHAEENPSGEVRVEGEVGVSFDGVEPFVTSDYELRRIDGQLRVEDFSDSRGETRLSEENAPGAPRVRGRDGMSIEVAAVTSFATVGHDDVQMNLWLDYAGQFVTPPGCSVSSCPSGAAGFFVFRDPSGRVHRPCCVNLTPARGVELASPAYVRFPREAVVNGGTLVWQYDVVMLAADQEITVDLPALELAGA